MPVYPLTNTSFSLLMPAAQGIVHRLNGLDVLEANLLMPQLCTVEDTIGKQKGQEVQFYRPQLMGSTTTIGATEGDIPSGQNYSQKIVRARLGLYTDWAALTTYQEDTSVTPDIQDMNERLSYSGATRVDLIHRAGFDAFSTEMNQAVDSGLYMTVRDYKRAVFSMWNQNIRGIKKFGGKFGVVTSPLNAYDLTNDPTVGGWTDLTKYTGMGGKGTPNFTFDMNGVFEDGVSNCRIMVTTNIKTSGSGANTLYRNYVMGEGGFGTVKLSGTNPNVGPRFRERFTVHVGTGGFGPWDPTGEMGSFVSYRMYVAMACLAGPPNIGDVFRGRIIDAKASIT